VRCSLLKRKDETCKAQLHHVTNAQPHQGNRPVGSAPSPPHKRRHFSSSTQSNQVSTHFTSRQVQPSREARISPQGTTGERERERERESKPFLTAAPSFIAFKSPNTDSHIITNTMTNKRPMTFEANENVLCFHGPLLYEAKVYCIEIKH